MLRQAGMYAREYSQGSLQDVWEQHNEAQILPIRNLDIAGNATKTILSTTRTSATTYYGPSKLSQIAGLAVAGLSLYSMFSGTSQNPYLNPVSHGGGVKTYNPNAQGNMGIPEE